MSLVIKTSKRWTRLLRFVQRLGDELKKPMTSTRRRSGVVVAGRIINSLVCTFSVSEQLTNHTLHDLNAALMRLDTVADVQGACSLELEIVTQLQTEIQNKISDLDQEVVASKSFS
jgi:hypothetical protein